jgi:hypothetical protein
MPDRSKVMTQSKRDTLVLQVGGCGVGLRTPSPKNNNIVRELMMIEIKSSRRPRHTKGCSTKEEEEEEDIYFIRRSRSSSDSIQTRLRGE